MIGVGETGTDFEELVPVEVSDLVADREVRQRLGTTGHDILQASGRHFGCTGWEVEDSFLKVLIFRDCHALSLVAGETNCHAQWKGLYAAAFGIAAKQDHGDGDAGGWHAGDEGFVRGDGGERKVDNGIALGLVGVGSGRIGELDVDDVSDRAVENELLNYEVDEEHDFSDGTQCVVHREHIFLEVAVSHVFGGQLGVDLLDGAGESIRQVVDHNAISLCPCWCEMGDLVE